jgi:hypothetical protein
MKLIPVIPDGDEDDTVHLSCRTWEGNIKKTRTVGVGTRDRREVFFAYWQPKIGQTKYSNSGHGRYHPEASPNSLATGRRRKVNTADTAPTQLIPAVRACLVNPDSLLDAPVAEHVAAGRHWRLLQLVQAYRAGEKSWRRGNHMISSILYLYLPN